MRSLNINKFSQTITCSPINSVISSPKDKFVNNNKIVFLEDNSDNLN
jgi:hypothetical protein